MVKSLFALYPDEIKSVLNLPKAFYGRQIFSWLYKGETEFRNMTDLPLVLRNSLCGQFEKEGGSVISSSAVETQEDDNGNCKLAIRLHDSLVIECVLLSNPEGSLTACLSSQAGCAMGCRFCRTGTLGLARNLEAFEIVEQFFHLRQFAVRKNMNSEISHVVFMGMGEPLANPDNVIRAVDFLHNPDAFGLGYRRITVSTCGFVPGIDRLLQSKIPVHLAVSLVSAIDSKRSELMPVNKVFNLQKLFAALKRFQKENRRRITFEYCMIPQHNMFREDAEALASACRKFEVIVNLIPFNACPELPFRSPSKAETKSFVALLDSFKVPYTIRISRGRSIKGACGQLAGKTGSGENSFL